MDVYEQNRRLGRGMNILGYDPVWKSRSKARMRDKHFRLIKEAGFNSVRIPLHPFRDAAIDERHRIVETWFETLDWAVEQSLSNGLMVILDLHEFRAMGEDPIGNRERFLATWKQIGERYKDLSSEVIFEILNEPNRNMTPELWNRFHSEAMLIIRETNPHRTVIIGPGNWNDINYLDKLELPEKDRNIIVTIHYYRPMEFTHQGTDWTSYRDKVGIEWKGTAEERQTIMKDFQKAQAWADRNDRPLFLGEFGAYDKADMNSRVRYISFVARQAEKLGWSWAYWQFDSDFIAYDIPHDRWIDPIRDALVPSGAK
ncbi:MAG: glycoside hydrolase family 5 protein [Candidatus Bathyarchaeia archaeon]